MALAVAAVALQLDKGFGPDRIPVPHAGIAQLVEHNLAKVGVASSSLVSRSKKSKTYVRLREFVESCGTKLWDKKSRERIPALVFVG